MIALTESRLHSFMEHAQLSLYLHDHYYHDRDASYREVLEWVDELVDLAIEVRRERAALERLVRLWEEHSHAAAGGGSSEELAARMYVLACQALGRSPGSVVHLPDPPAEARRVGVAAAAAGAA